MKALIIYSGGMDSSVLLHRYKKEIALAITFDYGSKHNQREIKAAKRNCEKLNIEHKIIELPFVNQYFKSSLLRSGGKIPKGSYEQETMKSTVVPFRNGVMLSIAVGIAESNNLDTILIANHFGDHDIYPDCRKEFIDAFSLTAKTGTYGQIKIHSPFCEINKREIALIGKEIKINFADTYSCYNGKKIHCGECSTCLERKDALKGFDNTKYLK